MSWTDGEKNVYMHGYIEKKKSGSLNSEKNVWFSNKKSNGERYCITHKKDRDENLDTTGSQTWWTQNTQINLDMSKVKEWN